MRKISITQIWSHALIIVTACALTACGTTERLNEFKTFATAGSAYVATVEPAINARFDLAIAVDSKTLLLARKDIPDKAYRLTALENADKNLMARRSYFVPIKQHARKLNEIFENLLKITDTKADEATEKQIVADITAVESLWPAFKNLQLGGKTPSAFIDEANIIAPILGAFRVNRLEKVLSKNDNKTKIKTQIEYQIAAMKAIADGMTEELKAQNGLLATEDVYKPYVDLTVKEVPSSWEAKRAAYVKAAAGLPDVEKAIEAANKLREAFDELCKGDGEKKIGKK